GRDFVAYQYYQNGQWVSYTANNTAQVWSAKYAQYNQLYAPKIGIYRITLEAEAHPCSGYDETNKPYYEVTLNWTSSLNEMSNEDVPQTYVIYEVTYNAQTGEEELVPIDTLVNPTTLTYTLPCPPNYKQEDHSVTHTYVIQGWPIDNDHPSFIAWSNQDDVVIPGLKDFLSLDLDHYESDFIISEEKNYYRNFLMVTNENETKAITTADLMNGMNKYKLYRYDLDKPESLEPFAEINFTKPTSVDATTVSYTITYEDQTIEGGNNSKYARSAMGIPDNGTLSVKGSGDVIIWPNDLSVNFMEITVTSGNTPLLKWTANSATPTTGSNRWHLSPGCKWVKYGNAYYLEGMGYIYINAGTTGDVTVTIKAYGDGSTTSKITVNDVTRTIVNGAANATTYNWTVPAANRAPMRDGNGLDNNATNN
ncbi:MAG: hypothetical protein IKS64_01665, partial [Muribaculaceae bacterium]|nr:hypothetical protein [Muribaculaceae bacterium]